MHGRRIVLKSDGDIGTGASFEGMRAVFVVTIW